MVVVGVEMGVKREEYEERKRYENGQVLRQTRKNKKYEKSEVIEWEDKVVRMKEEEEGEVVAVVVEQVVSLSVLISEKETRGERRMWKERKKFAYVIERHCRPRYNVPRRESHDGVSARVESR